MNADMTTAAMNDLDLHHRGLHAELRDAIDRVLKSGRFAMGPEVEAFEGEFGQYCGVAQCVAVANGTDALELSLRALDIGEGDEVVTAPNAGMYATTAILATGATPVFSDVDLDTLLMTSELVAPHIGPRTRALVVTHLFGRMAPMRGLARTAERHGLALIEDCAQAHGATQDGARAGAWGTVAAFSFYPTKNLGALGDGGAVVTDDSALAARVRRLREYGWERKYHCMLPGGRNSRLDELQAAVLRVKLPYLHHWNERRRTVAACYAKNLKHRDVTAPPTAGEDYVAHLFVARASRRAELLEVLRQHGIATDIHYPRLDYQQPALSSRFHSVTRPNSERAVGEVFSLPCYPEVRLSDAEQCCHVINSWDPA